MASKSSAAIRRPTDTEQIPTQMHAYQQVADLTEKAASLFREMEAVQQIHQHSAQRTALKLQQAAEQLRSSSSNAELFSIQSTLVMGGVQEMVQYMQEISATMMRMQVALVPKLPSGRVTEAAAASAVESSPASSALNGASTAADAASAATAAVFQSWSNMLGAGLAPKDGRATH
ncbi:MAG: hypothetical protein KGZ67_05605 [Hydrogenophaga sp.]|jgi:hypothetical protein|nr:hypothetical protein [Hydrogenophaga sp.]